MNTAELQSTSIKSFAIGLPIKIFSRTHKGGQRPSDTVQERRCSRRSADGAASIDAWNTDGAHVGAPWLVNRDGTIYRSFDDSGWIYHLGIKETHACYDRTSVAIEFANELDLILDGDELYAFGIIAPNTRYRGRYVTGDWRGATHFASTRPRSTPASS